MRSDKADFGVGPILFDGFGDLAIVFQGGGAGVDDDVVVVLRVLEAVLDVDVMGRTVEQPGVGDERGGLGEPGWIPEAGDFAPGLVARTRAAVKAIETGRRKE